MRQPISLRRRFTLGGFVLILVLVVALNVFVYLSLREQLMANLDDVLTSRAQLAGEIARTVPPEVLEARFIALGLRAEVHGPAERVILAEPLLDRFESLPPGSERVGAGGLVSKDVDFPDGYRITVYASRAGVDATLRRVLTLQALGTLGVLFAAGLILGRMSRLALRPLNEISTTARRIAEVGAGERLDVGDGDPELAAMAETFNEMLEALESALGDARDSEERSRRFLADAAHQLRTPIAAMRASVDALIRTQTRQERDRLIDNLLRETSRTSRLLNSLLRMAELDREETSVRIVADLAPILRDEADRIETLAPHLDVHVNIDPGATCEIDEQSLREAVANLLDNARRYAHTTISLGLERIDGLVRIAVADDGQGLDEADGERVFERFVTVGTGAGSGLGLPIVRAVAQSHGGDAYYRDGRFVIELPVATSGRPSEGPVDDPVEAVAWNPTV